MNESVSSEMERIYQTSSRQVFATLARLLRDLDLAEDALHEAFAAATAQWPHDGVPDNPIAWLVSSGRFKAIDLIRRREKTETGERGCCSANDRHWRVKRRSIGSGNRRRSIAVNLRMLPSGN